MEQAEWADALTEQVGRNIKSWREVRSLSAEQVSIRAAKVGLNISRQMITNLETGRRASLSVAELIVIAEALDVPAVALIYPPAKLNVEVEYLPNRVSGAVDAYEKFAALDVVGRQALDYWGMPLPVPAQYSAYRDLVRQESQVLQEVSANTPKRRSLPEDSARSMAEDLNGLHMKATLTYTASIRALLERNNVPFPPPSKLLFSLYEEFVDPKMMLFSARPESSK